MSFLQVLKNYPSRLKSLKDNLDNSVANLKLKQTNEVKDCDKQISFLKDIIKSNDSKINSLKKSLYDVVSYQYGDKSFDLLKTYLDPLKVKQSDIFPSGSVSNFEKLKTDIKNLLVDTKTINEKKIPLEEDKKKKVLAQHKKDMDLLNNKNNNALNGFINPIKDEYNKEFKNCVTNYTTRSVVKENTNMPNTICIGNYYFKTNKQYETLSSTNYLYTPCYINIKTEGNIAIQSNLSEFYDNLAEVENVLCGITLKYIESFPSGSIKLGMYSSSLSSMQKLTSIFTGLNNKNLTITKTPSQASQELAELLSLVDNKSNTINGKLLENHCLNLFDLYDKNIKTEPFQLIILHDVFRGMTEQELQSFIGLIKGQSKCGVRFIIADDFNEDVYQNKSQIFKSTIAQIYEMSNTFILNKNSFYDDKNENDLLLVKIDPSINEQFLYDFTSEYGDIQAKKKPEYLSYENIGFATSKGDSNNFDSIIIPVASNDPKIWEIEFNCIGNSPIANLIVGIPGTGKSTLIDSMIMNGAMKYSPDELTFQLLDFKDGISSSVYTMEDCKIPHIKVISQNNKPEEAEIILSNILLESERRNNEFISLRNETKLAIRNISEYNKIVKDTKYKRKNMPRLIIVIDECQYLFEDDALAKKAENIVRKCRSQGIHLVLATQTMSHKMHNTIKFVDGRYAFEIAKDDADQLLDRKYASVIQREVPKGSYMAFASNDSGQTCTKIKIAYDGGDTKKYAQQIRNKWKNYPIDLVMIGNKDPLIISNNELADLYKSTAKNEFILGENYSNHEMINVTYNRSRPLILTGTNQNVADNILNSLVYSSLRNKTKTYIVDASLDQNVLKFLKHFKHDENSYVIGDENKFIDIFKEINVIYKEREKNIRQEYQPIILIINGLQLITPVLNDEKMVLTLKKAKQVSNSNSLEALIANFESNDADRIEVNVKESLLSLLANAYKVNIFIALSIDNVSIRNNKGEQVFGYTQKGILCGADYKVLYQNITSDVKNIMEDSFKDKMVSLINENMAFLSLKQQSFYKFRYLQIDLNLKK